MVKTNGAFLLFLSHTHTRLSTSTNSQFLEKHFQKATSCCPIFLSCLGVRKKRCLLVSEALVFTFLTSARKPKCYLQIPQTSHGSLETAGNT